ncbi:hypothetical protein LEMLEM_LOCUS6956, partial [Lemmus lemmus]
PCQDDSLAFTVWPFLLWLVFMAAHRGCSKTGEMNPNAPASLAVFHPGCDGTAFLKIKGQSSYACQP